ncbi:unnamed protein product, partial [Rodentolepis nana]|uniref:GRIP domain-containing protein n=1 Tax=Rodentolepis nana TaxID=102285 RepID=A0A158QIG8_RODNA
MFSNLQDKISKDRNKKRSSDSRSVRSTIAAGSMMESTESLTSLNSAATNRKSDRIKYLEGKLDELKNLVRQKNASIESSAKEIDRLKTQLLQANEVSENAPSVVRFNHDIEETEDRSDLNSMLSKAEANLAAVNRLSEEVIAQKEELHRKTNMELESVKLNLLGAEEEIHTLRSQLADKLTENENLSRQLAHVSNEVEVKNMALEEAKDICSKMRSDQLAKDDALKLLESEKAVAEKRFNELSEELEKIKSTLTVQERTASESSGALKAAQLETENAFSKARCIEERAAEREADLQDRIRVLEERIVLLTEPDPALSEQIGQATLSTSSSIPSEESPEAVATRCATLLVEIAHKEADCFLLLNYQSAHLPLSLQRKLLETYLAEARKSLEDEKSTWNEKINIYESQITHLNKKISEDASEFAAERAQWESERQKLETELSESREKSIQAEAASLAAESKITEIERTLDEERRDWELTRASLEAKVSSLQENAKLESHNHAVALQSSQDLHSQISSLEKEVEAGSLAMEQLKLEKEELTKVLKSRIFALEQEASDKSQQIDKLTRGAEDRQTQLQARISVLEKELEDGFKTVGGLKEKELQSQIQALENEIERSSKLAANLEQEKAELKEGFQSMILTLESQLEVSTKEVEVLKAEQSELQQELQSRLANSEKLMEAKLQQTDEIGSQNEELKKDLQSRLQDLEQEVDVRAKQVVSLEKEKAEIMESLQSMISTLEVEVENRTKEVETLRQERSEIRQELEFRIADSEKNAEIGLQQIAALKRENEELKKELHSQVQFLEQERETGANQASTLKQEKEEIKEELQSMVAALELELENRAKEVEILRQSKSELQQELQLRITESEKKVKAELQQSNVLQRKNEELKEELQSKISELEKELENKSKMSELLKQEKMEMVTELQLHITNLEKELKAATAVTDALNAEREAQQQELQTRIVALEKTAESSSKSVDVLTKEKDKIQQELQQRIVTLEKDVEKRVKSVSKLKQEKEDLLVQIEAKTVEIGQLKEANSQQQSSTQQINDTVAKLEDQLSSLRNTNEDLRAEKENLEQAHQAHSSNMREKLASTEEELKSIQDKFAESQRSAQSVELECQSLRDVQTTLQSKIVEMEKDFAVRIAEMASNQKQELMDEVGSLKATIDELNEVISDRNKVNQQIKSLLFSSILSGSQLARLCPIELNSCSKVDWSVEMSTIRLQKQKLLELKKALGQGLRQGQGLYVAGSNLSLTEDDSHNQQQQQHRNSSL